MAPFRRTARNTSDNASIATPQTIEHERRTTGHSKLTGSSLHLPLRENIFILLEGLAFMSTLSGRCFCGEVQFEVTGVPAAMGYCHCESCRQWSAGPVNAFSLWKPEAVRVTQGADKIGTYNKTPRSARKFCKTCGGHLFTEHPHWNLTDV